MVCEYRAVNTMQECYSCHNYFRKDLILTFVSLYVCFEESNCIVFLLYVILLVLSSVLLSMARMSFLEIEGY